MSDRLMLAAAGAVLLGAFLSLPAPLALAAALSVAAILWPRPALVCIAGGVLATSLGARAWEGVLRAPTTGAVAGVATVVRDPEWVRGAVRVELRLDGRRLQAYARGRPAGAVADALAGEQLFVRGRLRPVSSSARHYLARRHIGANLTLDAASPGGRGGLTARLANEVRRTLDSGLASLQDDQRALFTGLVLGDDRNQSAQQVDDFRGAGLSHLLAVSGQNVAFVLAVAAPVLRRLGLRARFVGSLGVLALFGVVTRWEPSVIRAVGMAAAAGYATYVGRPASSLRLLALAVIAAVLVDPMLSGSIGFLLSCGACLGIATLAPRLATWMPQPMAVTLAAQVGVAPLVVPIFGGIPLASVPANLLAVPAAGPLMVWGIVAGLPAGLVGADAAAVAHIPTRLFLWWIAAVARGASGLPLPSISPRAAALAVGLVLAVLALRAVRPTWAAPATAGALAVTAVVVGATVLAAPPDASGRPLAEGVRLWRRGGSVVVVIAPTAVASGVLEGLREARVRRIDVLVVATANAQGADVAMAARHRAQVRMVVAPRGHRVARATTIEAHQAVSVGGLQITPLGTRSPLKVRVTSARGPPPR